MAMRYRSMGLEYDCAQCMRNSWSLLKFGVTFISAAYIPPIRITTNGNLADQLTYRHNHSRNRAVVEFIYRCILTDRPESRAEVKVIYVGNSARIFTSSIAKRLVPSALWQQGSIIISLRL